MHRQSMLRNRMAELFYNSVKIELLSIFDESLLIMLESQSKLGSNWREVRLITLIFVSSRLSGGACYLQFEEINVVILVCEDI